MSRQIEPFLTVAWYNAHELRTTLQYAEKKTETTQHSHTHNVFHAWICRCWIGAKKKLGTSKNFKSIFFLLSSRFASKPRKRLKTYRAHFLPFSLSLVSSCVVVYSTYTPYDSRLYTQVCECVLRMVNWCWMHTIVAARIKEQEAGAGEVETGRFEAKAGKKRTTRKLDLP